MTKIKLCGLSRETDIETANLLMPEYIGFVFAENSPRYVDKERASKLKRRLDPGILAVGVFVNGEPGIVASCLAEGIIDIAQLHGTEDHAYIRKLRKYTDKPLLKAYCIRRKEDLPAAEKSMADHILLDAGAGEGKTFDWSWLNDIKRPCFLAGGLTPENVADAIKAAHPAAVDVSSGIETGGYKDPVKMKAFVDAVRSVKNNG